MIFSTAYTISIMTLTADKKAQLRSFYYDVLRGGKLEKTWKRVQREFPGEYSRKQVKEFIDNQASAQETKPSSATSRSSPPSTPRSQAVSSRLT